MAPSAAANNVIGAVGGGVLAICSAPQLVKLLMTKKAADLSYLFLVLYTCGLVLTLVYLYFERALVGWIGICIEVTFATSLMLGKIYCDYFGPFSRRGLARAQPHGRLATDSGFAAATRPGMRSWLTSLSSAPALFPLLTHSLSHQAQHLLVDCRLVLPSAGGMMRTAGSTGTRTPAAGGAVGVPGVANGHSSSEEGRHALAAAKSPLSVLLEAVAMLEQALSSAGLPARQRHLQSFPSFSSCRPRQQQVQEQLWQQREQQQQQQALGQQQDSIVKRRRLSGSSDPLAEEEMQGARDVEAALDSAGPGTANDAANGTTNGTAAPTAEHPDMLFLSCLDGYATLMWYCHTATLALDLVAASPEAVERMNAAAEEFVRALSSSYPDSQVAVSSLARLPTQL